MFEELGREVEEVWGHGEPDAGSPITVILGKWASLLITRTSRPAWPAFMKARATAGALGLDGLEHTLAL